MRNTKMITIFAVVSGCVALCTLYRLGIPATMVVLLVTLGLLPYWFQNYERSKNQTQRLLDAQVYMEQLLYAFMHYGNLTTALKEIVLLFPEGRMHEVLNEAIELMIHDYEQEDALHSGLLLIEQNYDNERLRAIHRFLYKVEMIGGSCDGVIALMLRDLNDWKKRMDSYQKECKMAKSRIGVAIGIALFICMITNYILPQQIDLSGSQLRIMSTVILLILLLVIYTRADKRLSVNWLKHGYLSNNPVLVKRYKRYLAYDEQKEQRQSIQMAIVPFLIGLIAIYKALVPLVFLSVIVMVFLLNQHRIGHYLSHKSLVREIGKAFPQWLMELSLLLQIDNVQVSIAKTLESAPEILRPALNQFQQEINQNPESVQPYLDFLREFSVPQIQSAMKMLYAVSAGNGGTENEQLMELIDRNQMLMNQAEELMNEDALAGMYVLFLTPALAGAAKLMIDMTIFLVAFFTQINV